MQPFIIGVGWTSSLSPLISGCRHTSTDCILPFMDKYFLVTELHLMVVWLFQLPSYWVVSVFGRWNWISCRIFLHSNLENAFYNLIWVWFWVMVRFNQGWISNVSYISWQCRVWLKVWNRKGDYIESNDLISVFLENLFWFMTLACCRPLIEVRSYVSLLCDHNLQIIHVASSPYLHLHYYIHLYRAEREGL